MFLTFNANLGDSFGIGGGKGDDSILGSSGNDVIAGGDAGARRVRGRLAPDAMFPAGLPGYRVRMQPLASGERVRVVEAGPARRDEFRNRRAHVLSERSNGRSS